mmetsp:Transcript_3327/g.4434  ORF Transcript_3327/g.4434 Transcript_3327/m.4434 type:complete len:90 (-) Transcript_3327:141-410(-)
MIERSRNVLLSKTAQRKRTSNLLPQRLLQIADPRALVEIAKMRIGVPVDLVNMGDDEEQEQGCVLDKAVSESKRRNSTNLVIFKRLQVG